MILLVLIRDLMLEWWGKTLAWCLWDWHREHIQFTFMYLSDLWEGGEFSFELSKGEISWEQKNMKSVNFSSRKYFGSTQLAHFCIIAKYCTQSHVSSCLEINTLHSVSLSLFLLCSSVVQIGSCRKIFLIYCTCTDGTLFFQNGVLLFDREETQSDLNYMVSAYTFNTIVTRTTMHNALATLNFRLIQHKQQYQGVIFGDRAMMSNASHQSMSWAIYCPNHFTISQHRICCKHALD